jgi:hypothetical protein
VDFSDKEKFFKAHLLSIVDQELNSIFKESGKISQEFSIPKSSNGIQNVSSPEKKRGVSPDQSLISPDHSPKELFNEVIYSDENSSTESESENDDESDEKEGLLS